MEYWLQLPGSDPDHGDVWQFDGRSARKINVSDAAGINVIELGTERNIADAFQRNRPALNFYKLKLAPGKYYPHIARPINGALSDPLGLNPAEDNNRHKRANSAGQMMALIEQLQEICRVVHPIGNNMQVYGHEIRNVLMLACMEVEAHCKRILLSNAQTADNMGDFVKLSQPLKLTDYSVSFPYYPWLDPPLKPFDGWRPKSSLRWYAAYNSVKHDRAEKFSSGTLEATFQAVAGCFVLLAAQHGSDFVLQGKEAERAFLKLVDWPSWAPEDFYVCPYGIANWQPTEFPF